MWFQKNQPDRKEGVNGIVAVAIDKEKGSQHALKWAVDKLLNKSATVVLIHVKLISAPLSSSPSLSISSKKVIDDKEPDAKDRSIFLPYRVFCSRKDIRCKDVLLEDVDVSKAIIDYASQAGISHLVLGSSTKASLLKKFKVSDIPGTVAKGAPGFCTVYVVAKGKIQSMRSASRPAPSIPPQHNQLRQASISSDHSNSNVPLAHGVKEHGSQSIDATPRGSQDETEFFRSPFTMRGYNGRSYGDMLDTDISFVRAGWACTDRMFHASPSSSDTGISNYNLRLSYGSDTDGNHSFESMFNGRKSADISTPTDFSSDSDRLSSSTSQAVDDVEAEIRRLKMELKQTIDLYSSACKEALTAQQKAGELQHWKEEEERKLEEARLAEEAALAMAEKEKAKSKAAKEAAEAQERIAELEARKRLSAEIEAFREAGEKRTELDNVDDIAVRYRRYSIEEIEAATDYFSDSLKIGEGGYGPVFRCFLDHTSVAVKALRPDLSQGRSQFKREVEVLSCIRHPNMVLLLGACPEYGCLVYEYMANGSLEDRLYCRGNTPPLPWQVRFKIAAEIGTGLLFLHQTKPEPLVHRDLKPANILLDSNYVAKISDVGLARLVPPSIADTVTQYHMTSAAGTFCYIDPEYQQTGMLGVKSDIYSLGILFLQILTGRPPMGLAHHVENAIESEKFSEILDPKVPDWPLKEALSFAKLAVQCAELRRRDRPDLGNIVMPELEKLRELAENSNSYSAFGDCTNEPQQKQVSLVLDGSCPPTMNTSTGV